MIFDTNDNLIFNMRSSFPNWRIGFDLFAYILTPDRRVALPEAIAWNLMSSDEAAQATVDKPLLSLGPTSAQLLMDELWKVGIRPTEGSGSAGSLAATQTHLEDMRSLVQHYSQTQFKK